MSTYNLKNGITGLILVLFSILSFSVTAESRKNQSVMLIIDASGSMWGKIDGKSKIDIARKAVSRIVKTWNKETKIGIMAYGHRRKGDCSDIQIIAPLGKINANQVISILNDLNPKGKTPLSASIKTAATILKSSEEAATVILVSDGLETCGMDPCSVAKQLKKDNINFRTHVIGFDIKSIGDTSKLKCIAENTGGKYITANNTAELNKALREVKQVVAKKIVIKKVVKEVIVKKVVPKKIIVKTVKVNRYDAYKLPSNCINKRTMFFRSKMKIGGVKTCTKIIVSKGGELTLDNNSTFGSTILIIESGGKVHAMGNLGDSNVFIKSGGEFSSSAALHGSINNDGGKVTLHKGIVNLVTMDGGEFIMYDGMIQMLKANSGTIKITEKVNVINQTGTAPVNMIAPKK